MFHASIAEAAVQSCGYKTVGDCHYGNPWSGVLAVIEGKTQVWEVFDEAMENAF